MLLHRVLINELYFDFCCSCRCFCPNRETIIFTFQHTDSEESFILQTCTTFAVSWVVKFYVMRTAFKWSIIFHCNIPESLPSHKMLRKFKGTVLNEFTIQTTVCGVVDVFKKQSIHRFLYRSSDFIC